MRVLRFRLRFLARGVGGRGEACAAAVLTPCVRFPLIVAVIDKSLRQLDALVVLLPRRLKRLTRHVVAKIRLK
jgi:hypothetical protein